jgi:SPP1 gp7 family putative phage head morphogenesis protein
VEAYIVALVQAHITNAEATKRADRDIDLDWVDEMLEETDFVTLYRFDTEMERKKQRLIEALAATDHWNDEIDKALRYWTLQVGQYAINTVDRARLEAFKKAGVKKVRWNTEKDERVCKTCHALDGKVFEIDKAPNKQHINCRCWYSPVFE